MRNGRKVTHLTYQTEKVHKIYLRNSDYNNHVIPYFTDFAYSEIEIFIQTYLTSRILRLLDRTVPPCPTVSVQMSCDPYCCVPQGASERDMTIIKQRYHHLVYMPKFSNYHTNYSNQTECKLFPGCFIFSGKEPIG